MKRLKKGLSLFLTVIMVASAMSVVSFAEETDVKGGDTVSMREVISLPIGEAADINAAESVTEWLESAVVEGMPSGGMSLKDPAIASGQVSTVNGITTVSNDNIEFSVGSNGRFAMGTTGGDPGISTDDNKKLLYGHPHPGTSFTTIRIDGEDYAYEASGTPITTSTSHSSTMEIPLRGGQGRVVVTQKLSIVQNYNTGREDTVEVEYTVDNRDSVQHNIGIRIMLDTMLGSNDGSPFRVPGHGTVTSGLELTGSAVPQSWHSFDSIANPSVFSTGTLYNSQSQKPDKIQFTSWSYINGTYWEHQVPSYDFGDSAVAVYWNPSILAPNSSWRVSTYYGLGEFSATHSLDNFNVRVSVPSGLSAATVGGVGQYSPNPFTVTAYVNNTTGSELTNVTIENRVPPGLTITSAPSRAIGTIASYGEASTSWEIIADPVFTGTTAQFSIVVKTDQEQERSIPISVTLPALESGHVAKFETNGGTLLSPLVVRAGLSITNAPIPYRAGYEFLGWYSDPGLTPSNYVAFPFTPSGNITLYAKWGEVRNKGAIESGTKYLPYSYTLDKSSLGTNVRFSQVPYARPLPNGLYFDPETGTIYGVSREAGNYVFTVYVDSAEGAYCATYELSIRDVMDLGSSEYADEGYEILEYVGTPDSSQGRTKSDFDEEVFVSRGPYNEFRKLWFNGDELLRDVDYSAREGSTRITINSQTFARYGNGTHTISAEFRNTNNEVRVATEVFTIDAGLSPYDSGSQIDAAISPSGANFDKAAGGDITFTLLRGSYELRNLRNGSVELTKDIDYVINGNNITIKENYLLGLEAGRQTITVVMSGGLLPQFVITISDSAPLDAGQVVAALEPIVVKIELPVVVGDDGVARGEAVADAVTAAIAEARTKAEQAPANTPIILEFEIVGLPDGTQDLYVSYPAPVIGAIGGADNTSMRMNAGRLGVIGMDNPTLDSLVSRNGNEFGIGVSKNGEEVTLNIVMDEETLGKIEGKIRVAFPGLANGEVITLVRTDAGEEIVKKSSVENGSVYALLDGSGTIKVINNSKDFADIDGADWFYNAVTFANSRLLFRGISGSEMAPEIPMTRGMLATVLHNLENQASPDAEMTFDDVTTGEWFSEGIAWAADTGIVSGYGDGTYGVSDGISREQIAVMIMRYADYIGMDTYVRGDISGFLDARQISPWADDAVRWAVGIGLMRGNGDYLRPTSLASRAEAAVIVMNFINILVK